MLKSSCLGTPKIEAAQTPRTPCTLPKLPRMTSTYTRVPGLGAGSKPPPSNLKARASDVCTHQASVAWCLLAKLSMPLRGGATDNEGDGAGGTLPPQADAIKASVASVATTYLRIWVGIPLPSGIAPNQGYPACVSPQVDGPICARRYHWRRMAARDGCIARLLATLALHRLVRHRQSADEPLAPYMSPVSVRRQKMLHGTSTPTTCRRVLSRVGPETERRSDGGDRHLERPLGGW